jgi:Leucine-rich repeat (LRR) protein
LKELVFSSSQVSDISPLSNLTTLEYLWFSRNQVSDISPLVNNEGFDTGDYIRMENNYLDLSEGSQNMQDIETLISRGVIVDYEPQTNP